MTYEKPKVIVDNKGPVMEILCGHGNKCNGPKDKNSVLV